MFLYRVALAICLVPGSASSSTANIATDPDGNLVVSSGDGAAIRMNGVDVLESIDSNLQQTKRLQVESEEQVQC